MFIEYEQCLEYLNAVKIEVSSCQALIRKLKFNLHVILCNIFLATVTTKVIEIDIDIDIDIDIGIDIDNNR